MEITLLKKVVFEKEKKISIALQQKRTLKKYCIHFQEVAAFGEIPDNRRTQSNDRRRFNVPGGDAHIQFYSAFPDVGNGITFRPVGLFMIRVNTGPHEKVFLIGL